MPKILLASLALFGLLALTAAALTTTNTARPDPPLTRSTSVLPPPLNIGST